MATEGDLPEKENPHFEEQKGRSDDLAEREIHDLKEKNTHDLGRPVRQGPRRERGAPPYLIAVLDLGGQLPIDLSRLGVELNRIQSFFNFGVESLPITDLGPFDQRHLYSDGHLFPIIKNHSEGISDYAIGVTYHHLEQSSFNRHDVDLGVGIVSTANTMFAPPGRTLEQYIAYLLLCEAFCIVGGHDFEHEDRRTFCLFDLCGDLDELKHCLAHPHIDRDCIEKLIRIGKFSEEEINDAQKILRYVERTSFPQAVTKGLAHPVSSLLLGGFFGYLIGAVLADLPDPWPWLALIPLCLVSVFCIWWFGFPHRQ